MTFPRVSQFIARSYVLFGLLSIPCLTIVTTISIINVFARGQLAMSSLLEIFWIGVFAVAIEVNIVRLFYEWKLDNDRGALASGIGLVAVAGVALLLESLQQGIGFTWSSELVKWVVAIILALRVIVVVLLFAREGSRLGTTARAMMDDTPPIYGCLVSFPAPIIATEASAFDVSEIDTPAPNVRQLPAPKSITSTTKLHAILAKYPDMHDKEIARKAGVSVRTVQRHKARHIVS